MCVQGCHKLSMASKSFVLSRPSVIKGRRFFIAERSEQYGGKDNELTGDKSGQDRK